MNKSYEFLRYDVTSTGTRCDSCCQNSKVIASLPSSHLLSLSYFHSFGITENYIVFLEQSVLLNYFYLMLTIIRNEPLARAFQTDKHFNTRIHLINKHTGHIVKQKFITKPQFSFHFLNCFEEYDSDQKLKQINIDVCSYELDDFNIENLTYENMYAGKLNESDLLKSLAKRIVVPIRNESPSSIEVECDLQVINSKVSFELPVINYSRCNGKRYLFTYGVNYYKLPFSIMKININNENEILEIKYESDVENDLLLPSEPIFVETPHDNGEEFDEDDGVLLVMVMSMECNDFLSIVDAKTMIETARCELDGIKCALSFHGFFADNQSYPELNK